MVSLATLRLARLTAAFICGCFITVVVQAFFYLPFGVRYNYIRDRRYRVDLNHTTIDVIHHRHSRELAEGALHPVNVAGVLSGAQRPLFTGSGNETQYPLSGSGNKSLPATENNLYTSTLALNTSEGGTKVASAPGSIASSRSEFSNTLAKNEFRGSEEATSIPHNASNPAPQLHRCSHGAATYNLTECQRRLPNALIIGVQKGGTCAMRFFLNAHPDIVSQPWELKYFDLHYNKGSEWYRQQQPYSLPHQMTIEKSPTYFHHQEVPARVKRMNPNMKIILLLRNPVKRLIGDYAMHKALKAAEGKTLLPFEKMFSKSNRKRKLKTTSSLIRMGKYYMRIEAWFKMFGRENILILNGDTFGKDPLPQLKEAEKYLGLPHKLTSDVVFYNEARGFHCIKVDGKEQCLGEGKGRDKPKVDTWLLRKLQDYYQPYNEKLFRIIKRRFDWAQPIVQ